ncbi:orotidine-5'-phosphate decarboxylase [Sandaracinus amylolyticus]|nr:orotidine-5'-phosphate decarboxylase [Sandaracinus amylolyticus]
MMRSGRERLVFPLDVEDLAEARQWIARLRDHVGVFKVGLELFTAIGPDAVRAVHDAGAACFLDLKLHDIPATMAGATASAVRLGVRYLTVHAAAGPAALRAVAGAAANSGTTLLAVTVLTSLDRGELDAIGMRGEPADAATRLAGVARDAGVLGLVCSPHEVATLRGVVGEGGVIVVPGVRPAGADAGDQRRVATPTDAIAAGADLLVVGRPIRNARDPESAARAIASEIEAAIR